MIGKFAMTAAYGTVVLFAQEIYPTNVRSNIVLYIAALAAILTHFCACISLRSVLSHSG